MNTSRKLKVPCKLKVPLQQQVIWLVGASSGIGEALVQQLAGCCEQLVISSRNHHKLVQLARQHPGVSVIPADVTDPDSMKQAAALIEEIFGRLDCLLFNAGTCEYLKVQQFDSELVKRVMDTNFNGLVNTIEAGLPLLRQSQRGYLIGVSSSVTYLALSRAEAYGASKAAMTYLLESLRVDLADEQIDVSVVSPGFVKTPLTDRNNFPMPMLISAGQAARTIVDALPARPLEIHFPKRFTWLLKILGSLPAPLRLALARRMTSKSSRPANSQEHLS
ncbi:SDR family NAD(P)-dependent oxidoreductase [Oceanobacter mangrovi]|uniref:SDR family NAD(P)-dependent oxidoreductase n=1 Tax=Oceanobacter mangrovi TaxID=2862510 RepID=UPI001C8EDCBF|nr:SDR family NAD(P)-dependent oxidoreductase [Oceanobacter mangrovi]